MEMHALQWLSSKIQLKRFELSSCIMGNPFPVVIWLFTCITVPEKNFPMKVLVCRIFNINWMIYGFYFVISMFFFLCQVWVWVQTANQDHKIKAILTLLRMIWMHIFQMQQPQTQLMRCSWCCRDDVAQWSNGICYCQSPAKGSQFGGFTVRISNEDWSNETSTLS